MFTVDCDRLTKKEQTPSFTFCYLCITTAVGRIRDTSSSTHVAGLLCFLCDLLLVCAGWLSVCGGPCSRRVSVSLLTLLLSGEKLLGCYLLLWFGCSSSLVLSSVIFMLCLLPCFLRFDNLLCFLAHCLFCPHALASFSFQIWFSYFEHTNGDRHSGSKPL